MCHLFQYFPAISYTIACFSSPVLEGLPNMASRSHFTHPWFDGKSLTFKANTSEHKTDYKQ